MLWIKKLPGNNFGGARWTSFGIRDSHSRKVTGSDVIEPYDHSVRVELTSSTVRLAVVDRLNTRCKCRGVRPCAPSQMVYVVVTVGTGYADTLGFCFVLDAVPNSHMLVRRRNPLNEKRKYNDDSRGHHKRDCTPCRGGAQYTRRRPHRRCG